MLGMSKEFLMRHRENDTTDNETTAKINAYTDETVQLQELACGLAIIPQIIVLNISWSIFHNNEYVWKEICCM